jgi:hypothetical protein
VEVKLHPFVILVISSPVGLSSRKSLQVSPDRTLRVHGVLGSVVGRGTTPQARRSRVRFPMRSLGFSIDLILPAAPSTWPLTEMGFKNLPGGKGQPTHKVGNLTAICESII